MATYRNFAKNKTNGYEAGLVQKIAANSLNAGMGTVLKLPAGTGYVSAAGAGDVVEGISLTEQIFSASNQTSPQAQVLYEPAAKTPRWQATIGGTSIVFAGNFITGNTINLSINGTAMTAVNFDTNNATTLADIVTQLNSQFSAVIGTAVASGAHTIIIPTLGNNNTVVITGIVVTGGASQTTGAVVGLISQTNVGDYFNINATQTIDATSASTTTGQFRLEVFQNQEIGIFSIANQFISNTGPTGATGATGYTGPTGPTGP